MKNKKPSLSIIVIKLIFFYALSILMTLLTINLFQENSMLFGLINALIAIILFSYSIGRTMTEIRKRKGNAFTNKVILTFMAVSFVILIITTII